MVSAVGLFSEPGCHVVGCFGECGRYVQFAVLLSRENMFYLTFVQY